MTSNHKYTVWPPEDIQRLKEKYPVCSSDELVKIFPDKSVKAIRSKAKVLKLKKANRKIFVFSPEQEATLIRLFPRTTSKDIANQLGCSIFSVIHRATKLGLKKDPEFVRDTNRQLALSLAESGKAFRYKKGSVPANKGKKMSKEAYERNKHTMFKKGHIPKNHKPVGYETINIDGYILIKTKEPNVFELKHRVLWREAYGEIPPGHVIRFKDGNKQNLSLDNLEMVTKAQNLEPNTIHRYPADLKKAIRVIGQLNKTINKHEKHKS